MEADKVYRPTITSGNFQAGDIKKNWVYASDSPIGPAYHFQAKTWITAPFGTTVYLNSKMKANAASGRAKSYTGAYWPYPAWATAWLDSN
ncbi:hypothetical protein [Halomarina oriensis]|uniref:Uncharacterized protein n=1 Tax=Halomarina oriensis TaxID=671145 RepID=A0A6B0GL96_9EURY|nr:hypothetical protein [Halomarina oriensis]MWG35410.1 hypothetical protein [Halomarina oriensis]